MEVFFFDGEWVGWWTAEDGKELYRFILSLNPDCIVNNRVGKRGEADGDYGTPEQQVPANGLDYDWESNVTMNDSWGYKKGDTNWKSTQWIISNVVDIASKGGNLLLNVGPDGSGAVEAEPLERMAEAGKWLEKYGDAVYGTEKTCFSKSLGAGIKVTTRPSEGKIFVTLLEKDPKEVDSIILPPLENKILSVKEMSDGKDVVFNTFDGGIYLQISETTKQDYATVYEITVDGEPKEKTYKAAQLGENLAKGKTVITGSEYEGKEGSRLTDGDVTVNNDNRWAPLDSDNDPWAIIDLGEEKNVEEVVIKEWKDTFYTQKYRVAGFKLAVSSDNENWTEVYSGKAIGESLSANIGKVSCRYIKLFDITKTSDAKGTPSFHEIEVYEEHQPNPSVAFEKMPEKIEALPFTVSGTYSDGEKVTLKVWGASFAAFSVEAEVNEDGTWSAVIEKDMISEGDLTLTATLADENGTEISAAVTAIKY